MHLEHCSWTQDPNLSSTICEKAELFGFQVLHQQESGLELDVHSTLLPLTLSSSERNDAVASGPNFPCDLKFVLLVLILTEPYLLIMNTCSVILLNPSIFFPNPTGPV